MAPSESLLTGYDCKCTQLDLFRQEWHILYDYESYYGFVTFSADLENEVNNLRYFLFFWGYYGAREGKLSNLASCTIEYGPQNCPIAARAQTER